MLSMLWLLSACLLHCCSSFRFSIPHQQRVRYAPILLKAAQVTKSRALQVTTTAGENGNGEDLSHLQNEFRSLSKGVVQSIWYVTCPHMSNQSYTCRWKIDQVWYIHAMGRDTSIAGRQESFYCILVLSLSYKLSVLLMISLYRIRQLSFFQGDKTDLVRLLDLRLTVLISI